ncbi:oligosaccharide flippase family protein [Sphingomonas humi]|uniref:Polysaccharide biosynthesis protein n=1 Tax=Sphingomonas humi TaxID=335630 RepID=A0ABP7SD68_9SPHN
MTEAAAAAKDQSSYRRILASTSIIGGATVATILIGIVRTKILALLSGPEGIGLLGILTNVSGLVTTIAGFGLAAAAVRDLSSADTPLRKAEVRRALWAGSLPLAAIGALLLWIFRGPVSGLAAGSGDFALLIGLSGIAVLFGVAAAAQQAVLQGLQRIWALGVVRVGSALGATLLAIPAVWWFGNAGMVVAVIAVPLAACLTAVPFLPRGDVKAGRFRLGPVARDIRSMAALGGALTLTGAVQMLTLAAVRTIVVQQDGLEQAGLLQAVFAITTMNITLVLGAMSADYFPRLSAARGGDEESRGIVNNQLHVALLFGAPLTIAMVAGAPLVLSLLYSSQFAGAEAMLRWQVIGDLVKIPCWALGFVLLARGDRKAYVAVELLFAAVYVAAAFALVPRLGLAGTGVAYLLAYLAYGLVIAVLCRRRHAIVISRENGLLIAGALIVLVLLKLVSDYSEPLAFIGGGALALSAALLSLRSLGARTGLSIRKLGR